MIELTDKQIAEYFHRSYTTADGLWFIKVEEKYGFEQALEIDNEVWKVLPKIQARFLKSTGKMEKGIDALFRCLSTKLSIDGFNFRGEKIINGNGFKIIIGECPWHNLMIKSGRKEYSEQVGSLICKTEYSIWASEFDDDIDFKLKNQICKGSKFCILFYFRNSFKRYFSGVY